MAQITTMLPRPGVAIQGVLEMQQVRLVPLPSALALDLTMKSSLYVIIMVVAGLISVASSDLNAKSDEGCFL
jgi:hypothetical protein